MCFWDASLRYIMDWRSTPPVGKIPLMATELCLYCNGAIPARRAKLKTHSRFYCCNDCKLDHEDLTSSAAQKPLSEQTYDEILSDVPPAGASFMDLLQWAAKKATKAFEEARAKRAQEATARGEEAARAVPPGPETASGSQPPPKPKPVIRTPEAEKEHLLRCLRLPTTATLDDVHARRKTLAKKYHPDVAGTGSVKAMTEINGIASRLEVLMSPKTQESTG